ncbi:Pentafunctional arom polypeptide [Mycena indigotica]|uniref:Pentafunctional arom polypeptide n=1 Tax=Mycena indigotica TaxID=2126181 RepID=A0A8H6T1Q8_9AGAR|nr:Pentafunctional arom polypeptide [Mycena indigotica]KAF7309398.1 Pentafunctional arom polypeptide [Mycena indigotica]
MTSTGSKFYLFGFPIAHSSAPMLHNHCFHALEGGTTQKTFTLWSTSKVTEEMVRVIRGDECGGAAVTMPLKADIIPFLDSLAPEAALTNACNTIVKVGGRLVGQNTDILGVRNALLGALRAQFPSLAIPSNDTARFLNTNGPPLAGLVIGGGATTRSAAQALSLLGLSRIFLVNRDEDEVRLVIDSMSHLREHFVHLRDPQDVEEHLVGEGKARLLMVVGCIPSIPPQTYEERMVYTTVSAVLTTPYLPVSTPSSALPYPTRRLFLEMPYKPLHTTLYKLADAHGWHVIDGIQAMIEQGFAQQRMWRRGEATLAVGSDASITGEVMETRARQAVQAHINVPEEDSEVDRAGSELS